MGQWEDKSLNILIKRRQLRGKLSFCLQSVFCTAKTFKYYFFFTIVYISSFIYIVEFYFLPTDIEFYIGLPEELHYRTPRIIIWKMLDAASYIQNFKGDTDILKLTSQSPTDFKSVSQICSQDTQ